MTADVPDILNAIIPIVDDQESNVTLLEQLLGEASYTHVAPTMIHTRCARCIGKMATT